MRDVMTMTKQQRANYSEIGGVYFDGTWAGM